MSSEPKAVAWKYRVRYGEVLGKWYVVDEEISNSENIDARPLYDEQALSALRAEVEALRRDAERYRFIERLAGGTPDEFAVVEDAAFASHYGNGHNFGMNIDAAMENPA